MVEAPPRRYLKFSQLKDRGIVTNRVTLQRWIDAGKFPSPVELGPNSVAWPEDEIAAWEAERLAQRERDRAARSAAWRERHGCGAAVAA